MFVYRINDSTLHTDTDFIYILKKLLHIKNVLLSSDQFILKIQAEKNI